MATKAELEAEVQRLREQLSALEKDQAETDEATGLKVGQEYWLSVGHATIVRFYEEDDLHKVQSLIRPFDPSDGVTLLDGERLCSMPVEAFLKRAKEYRSDQLERERENRRLEKLRA